MSIYNISPEQLAAYHKAKEQIDAGNATWADYPSYMFILRETPLAEITPEQWRQFLIADAENNGSWRDYPRWMFLLKADILDDSDMFSRSRKQSWNQK